MESGRGNRDIVGGGDSASGTTDAKLSVAASFDLLHRYIILYRHRGPGGYHNIYHYYRIHSLLGFGRSKYESITRDDTDTVIAHRSLIFGVLIKTTKHREPRNIQPAADGNKVFVLRSNRFTTQ